MAHSRILGTVRNRFKVREYEVKGKNKRYSITDLQTGEKHTGINLEGLFKSVEALEKTHDLARTFKNIYFQSGKGKTELRIKMREGIKTRFNDVYGVGSDMAEYANYLIDKFSDRKWADFVNENERFFTEQWDFYHAGVYQSDKELREYYGILIEKMESTLREKGVLVR